MTTSELFRQHVGNALSQCGGTFVGVKEALKAGDLLILVSDSFDSYLGKRLPPMSAPDVVEQALYTDIGGWIIV